MRIRSDDGLIVEALRATVLETESRSWNAQLPLINQVDQVLADGTRICRATYEYASSAPASDASPQADTPNAGTIDAFPPMLVKHKDIEGAERTYRYVDRLIVGLTTFSGFEYWIEWRSLEAIKERWALSPLSDEELHTRYPIDARNSYRARAVRVRSQDGLDEVAVDYVDPDTSLVTEPGGGVLEYRFDHNWLVVNVIRHSPGGRKKSLGRREWDDDGKLLADYDAVGNATRYGFDRQGNITSVTDPLGNTTTMVYDGAGQLLSETDPMGNKWQFEYDQQGNLIRETNPLGYSTSYAYDQLGRVSVITDARGGTKTVDYDQHGRVCSYTDCSRLTTRYEYDSTGRLVRTILPNGEQSQMRYGRRGELVELIAPDGSVERFVYDAANRLIEYADHAGAHTRYSYNGHDLPVERVDALGHKIRYLYDRALQVSELVNENGECHRLTYDVEGRLISEIGIDGKHTAYEYDPAGQLIAKTLDGARTTFLRDRVGQVEAKQNMDGTVRYAYDPLGRIVAMQSRFADHRFVYDPLGHLIEERFAYATENDPLQPEPVYDAAFTLKRAFDEIGNHIETLLPNGRRIQVQRYGSGHWHGTLWQQTNIIDVERDNLHRETERRFSAGQDVVAWSKQYDPAWRLSRMALQRNGRQVSERKFVYDAAGRLKSVEDSKQGITRYGYDQIGRLISATHPDRKELFAFDPAGNILDYGYASETRAGQHPSKDLVDQPPPHTTPKLAVVTQNLLRSYAGVTYHYDVRGNTVCRTAPSQYSANDEPSLSMDYDHENRLVRVVSTWPNIVRTAKYTYDSLGRRIAKEVTSVAMREAGQQAPDSQRQLTLFIWDGDALCQEISATTTTNFLYEPDTFVPIAMIESDGGTSMYGPETVHRAAVESWRPPRPTADQDEQVRAYQAATTAEIENAHRQLFDGRVRQAEDIAKTDRIYRYVTDHIGTPTDLLDEQGEVAWSARYLAWGRLKDARGRVSRQPLRFQGQYQDDETGLHYNRYRYYDPHSGRYLTKDPIGLAGGRNLYRYVPSPNEFVDPLGLFAAATYVYGIGGRIESATATVTLADLDKGSDTNKTSRRWARRLGCPDDDAGHVIGNQLGGRGGKRYVFPQAPSINRGAFAQWESSIARAIRRHKTPATITVDLQYTGTSTRPDRIVYTFTINGVTTSRPFVNPRSCP